MNKQQVLTSSNPPWTRCPAPTDAPLRAPTLLGRVPRATCEGGPDVAGQVHRLGDPAWLQRARSLHQGRGLPPRRWRGDAARGDVRVLMGVGALVPGSGAAAAVHECRIDANWPPGMSMFRIS